ncbi:alpha/beta hydrolase [Prosthecobacter debontii]|uniref:alpha/beta hydrolase n=1 Tax=Prosthecobacter debontii TaxID=48467 RepID=UPI001591C0CD|nr:alpha/beta fold hydrolase [Prosthecobacter debontii]
MDLNTYFVPATQPGVAPVLIVSHGAGDCKENYLEMAAYLSKHGIACLLMDMHGHGASGGIAYHVRMDEWEADLKAALDYLQTRPDVDIGRVGAFGISSGGTAILEAALTDPRLKALIAMDATVMNTLPWSLTVTMGLLILIGHIKKALTGSDLRISIAKMLDDVELASDPEVNARLQVDPGKIRAFQNFPLPGATQSFFVDTIRRVPQIKAPTLVIWGEDDQLDPVSTAHALHNALTCPKRLEIIPGNGHAGHMDRNRVKVFEVMIEWLKQHLA